MQKTFITALALAIMALGSSPAHADRVHLINGDVMSGYIRTLHEPSGLDFRVNNGHIFNIPWSNIAGLYDDNNQPISMPALSEAQPVGTSAPTVQRPHLTPPPNTGAGPIPLNTQGVEVASVNAVPVSTPPPARAYHYASAPLLGSPRTPRLKQWQSFDQAVAASATSPAAGEEENNAPKTGWLGAVWKGRANFGASLQQGNTENNAIAADASLKAKWDDTHRATLKAEYNREEDDGNVTEDNRKLSAIYDWFFVKKWFLNSNASFEQDDINDIDLRTVFGFGLGHQPFESEDLNLQYVLGPAYLRTEFEDGSEEDSLAAHWALDYDQYYFDKLFQGFHEHELLVPTDDTDAFLFNSKTGLRMPIRGGIIGTAEVDFDWDNAPEPGIKEDDTTYSLKLGYEW